jgi:hypothetical protein
MARTIPQFRRKGKIANSSPHDQVWLTAQQNYLCESFRDIIQYLRGKYLVTTLVVKLGKFSDLRQRLYCPFFRLLVTSAPLAPRMNERENIEVTLRGGIECNALPLGIHKSRITFK